MARKLEVEIIGDASRLSKSFGKASKSASSFGDKMAKAGKLAAAGLAGGVALGVVVLKKSVDAALDAEKAQTRLDAAFKATSASAKQRAAAMTAVNAVSIKSGLDDEDLSDTLTALTRVTGDVSKAQTEMGLAADIARGRGIDLASATKIVTKADLGLVGGLKRIGIEIPKVTAAQDALKAAHVKATAAQIAAAKAADDAATRQSAIAALQKQYSGAAEAYGKTAAGAQERFQVAVENLQEALGAKFLPVLTDVLDWAVKNMPTFERVMSTVFDNVGKALGALASFFEANWPRIKQAGVTVLAWYQTNLQPTIISITGNIARAWGSMTDSLKADTDRNFGSSGGGGGGILGIVVARLSVMLHFFNAALAALRGDWSKAWKELQAGAQQNLASMKDAFVGIWTLIVHAVSALVGKLVSGIVNGLKALPLAIAGALSALGAQIRGWANSARAYAFSIGSAIVDGIISGLGDIAGKIGGKLVAGFHGGLDALKNAAGIKSPSTVMAEQVGKPLAEGILMGFLVGSQDLPAKISEKLRTALEAGRATIEAARGKFGDAFSGLSTDILSAFDGIAAGIKTKSEKLLAALDLKEQLKSIKQGIADAQGAVAAAAVQGEDETPEAFAQRQKDAAQQLADALLAQTRFNLEAAAAEERKQLDARLALRRRHLEDSLTALQNSLTKEGATTGQATDAILKLLRKYGVSFKAAGAELGVAFVEGLKEMLAAAAGKAGALKGKIGSVADGIDVPKLAAGGLVTKTGLAEVHRGETFSGVGPLRGGGGMGATVNVYVSGIVGDENAVIERIRRGLLQVGFRNGSVGLA